MLVEFTFYNTQTIIPMTAKKQSLCVTKLLVSGNKHTSSKAGC